MARFLAGAAACFLLMTGAFLFWQSRAADHPSLPSAPAAHTTAAAALFGTAEPLEAPEASPKSREEKRFSRADKNKDGKIEEEERLAARRKAFAKLDVNGNGSLSFEEWATKTISKFKGADADHNGWLTPAEYSTTAPWPRSARPAAVDSSSRSPPTITTNEPRTARALSVAGKLHCCHCC